MPVYSMTGYASATAGVGATSETGTIAESPTPRPAGAATSVTVELRSVNGRFLDLNFRMPDEFRSLEPALRDLLAAALRRGWRRDRASCAGITQIRYEGLRCHPHSQRCALPCRIACVANFDER